MQATRWHRRLMRWGGSAVVCGALVTAWLHGLSDDEPGPAPERLGTVAGTSATACTPEDVGPAAGVVLAVFTDGAPVLRVDPTSGMPSSGGGPVDVRVDVEGQDPVVTVGREVGLRIECRDGAFATVSLDLP